ncbi:helix-turn-helix transcriptional regulator [Streptomyces ochraceiscleroticus]|uniref:Helix-turn-helix transcriptional regulator n=1 Tax=Streptomyces ochraceiscleroticus TaxID=47761 RepID=A0ABW1MDV0_9ACTN|nr:helix-turn-helix transcriptional regulator [Streptomyces ochraceiscleroticus]
MTVTTLPAPARDAARVRRHELAAFLRSRRERITPERVGLPRGPRRRTPGLRREEVAQLAAVGVTWYTWLEQARDIHVSAQVLDAVARALLFDASERAHLFALADAVDPAPGGECAVVSPELRQVLAQLEPFPACVQNRRYDILAYNRTYGRLLTDLDALEPQDRNCLWLTFTHPEWRAAVPDLEKTLGQMTARFRAAMAEHVAEPAWKALLKRLQRASPEFRELWDRHEVLCARAKTKTFENPEVGLVRVANTPLYVGAREGIRVTVYSPQDETSRERLERLRELAVAAEEAKAAAEAGAAEGAEAVAS